VRRSAAASALEDGPKFFEDVPDNVMLHAERRERLVRLLAKHQYFALLLHHELTAAHSDHMSAPAGMLDPDWRLE
jgi:hypothetical protein